MSETAVIALLPLLPLLAPSLSEVFHFLFLGQIVNFIRPKFNNICIHQSACQAFPVVLVSKNISSSESKMLAVYGPHSVLTQSKESFL